MFGKSAKQIELETTIEELQGQISQLNQQLQQKDQVVNEEKKKTQAKQQELDRALDFEKFLQDTNKVKCTINALYRATHKAKSLVSQAKAEREAARAALTKQQPVWPPRVELFPGVAGGVGVAQDSLSNTEEDPEAQQLQLEIDGLGFPSVRKTELLVFNPAAGQSQQLRKDPLTKDSLLEQSHCKHVLFFLKKLFVEETSLRTTLNKWEQFFRTGDRSKQEDKNR
ncbi:unnamed protein product, partial [Amoebophrya sp. A120]|eukprot:GSA120T00010803001.1